VIRLQFVLGKALSSRLIAWYGQGYGGYSHVDAVLSDGSLLGARSDRITVKDGHTYPAGVQIRPQGYERWVVRTTVELPCDPLLTIRWEHYLRDQVGEPYDKQAIVGFLLGQRAHAKGHWICSALQRKALRRVTLLHYCPIPESQTTPDALFQLVTAGLGGAVTQHHQVTHGGAPA
jgi:hypothetical protein